MSGGPERFDRATVAARVSRSLPDLRALFGESVTTNTAIRDQHGHGEGIPDAAAPDAVVFPRSTDEVASLVHWALAAEVPLIPFGTGTSLEGQVVAVCGGVAVDLRDMNRVLAVTPEALDCRVEAGTTRLALNAHLRSSGIHFPIDPGADASIGGMAATRASGTAAVRYGTMRDAVLGLTVVTGTGEIVRTGSRARKSASGYDLTRLYVGSEGTLGIITEVQLRLHPLPQRIVAAVCQFPTVTSCMEVVIGVLHSGVPIARMELLNSTQMRMSVQHSRLVDMTADPTLFFEFHGSDRSVAAEIEIIEALANDAGGGSFRWAKTPEEQSRLWKARHEAYYANLAYQPGCQVISTDACVPISEIAACIAETERDITTTGLTVALSGHVGDGNFHLGILFDPLDPTSRRLADDLATRTGERAIRMGGTCSGEHGIGMHKRTLAALEHGNAGDLMWLIKMGLDPHQIMNPGKLLPLSTPPIDGRSVIHTSQR